MGATNMTGWRSGTIGEDAHIVLTDWAVMQVSLGGADGAVTRHFIGIRGGRPPRAQVSSPVVTFDPHSVRGVTESGRIYQLNGFSPVSVAVLATWTRWKEINRIVDDRNVSSEVVRDIFAAAGAFERPAS